MMKYSFYIVGLLFIYSCVSPNSKTDNKSNEKGYTIKVNECFEERFGKMVGGSGNTYVISGNPKYENFRKYTLINDSQYVFSAGNGFKEVVLDTFKCGHQTREPLIMHEDHDFMHFVYGCGSNCWGDIFLDFNHDTVYSTQSFFLDTILMRFVEIESLNEKNETYFYVHDFRSKTCDTLKSTHYIAAPSLWIKNVELNVVDPYYLCYSAKLRGDSLVRDTIMLYR